MPRRPSSRRPQRPRQRRAAPPRETYEDSYDDSADTLQVELREAPHRQDIGKIINNRYKITGLIGEGGMGIVFESYDMQVDRKVAIKLVRRECLSDRTFLTRFRRELEITSQFRHPSTIRVYEHGETIDGRPYMVMELLTGESLAEMLERSASIPEMEALGYARQIAESLSEAHEHEVFHRDLKPDNIFIESVGVSTVVKVLDFGIAGGFDAMKLTKAGEVFGTPQYMSPEQCNGQSLDYRTDIYSLGCILYEMLEGRPPFSAETPMATMLKHVRAKVPPPRNCTQSTARLLQLALRKDRNKRIQSMGRFAELIGECMGAVRAVEEGRPAPELSVGRRGATIPPRTPSSGGLTTLPTQSLHPSAGAAAKLGLDSTTITGAIIVGAVLVLGLGVWFFTRPTDPTLPTTTVTAADVEHAGGTGDEDAGVLPKTRRLVTTNVDEATVFVDGEELCVTPCEIEVEVGSKDRHEIRLTKEGYIDVVVNWQPKTLTDPLPTFPPMAPEATSIEVGTGKTKKRKKR
ncbi:MAG: serine/threonine protein kinase [Myxococcales bacterium]|nr:serine/threonine protein kinase [Myxococcales bacterium]MCB9754330.1 serine/threonine protein kinase [Myxococcales bacterium]